MRTHRGASQRTQICIAKQDFASLCIVQTHDASGHCRFARPTLADDAKRLAARKIKGYIICSVNNPPFAAKQSATASVGLFKLVDPHHDFGGPSTCRARREFRHSSDQRLRIRMLRGAKNLISGAGFNDQSVLHHGHPIRDISHNAEVMSDEQYTRAVRGLHFLDQPQNLRLRCHVQRRGWFVRNQDFRIERQRHCDHRALPLSTREFVRIGFDRLLRVRQLHVAQQFQRPTPPLFARHLVVKAEDLVDLGPDRHDRVQRRHRLLKDHRYL